MLGYNGINCTSLCPFPRYGVDCQGTCNCSKDLCDVSTGCIGSTTGKHIEKYLQSKAAVNENVNDLKKHLYYLYLCYIVYNCSVSLLQTNEIIV